MVVGFETDDPAAATAALILYTVYRSRDESFKVTPDMWGRIERALISSAKRATSLADLLQSLKPKLRCSTLTAPRQATYGDRWAELTDVLSSANADGVLQTAYRRASYVVLLVRDRLERERADRAAGAESRETTDTEAM